MSVFNIDVGLKIFNARKSLKMSRSELGKKINLHESTIKRYEDGHIKSLDIEKLKEFANALDISPEYLMGLEDNKTMNNLNFNPNVITEKDEKHIQKDLKEIMDDFKTGHDGPAFYNGIELGDEELELIEQAMELALKSAKLKNKAKYTPKKYKNEK
ncbi:MAG: helix-turn-helix domain-containing protein [Peptostreptococcaceae bacterium]